jgi:hypothetical protein
LLLQDFFLLYPIKIKIFIVIFRWSVASEAISGGELFYIECKAQNLLLAQKMKKKLHQSGASSSSKSRSWRKGAHGNENFISFFLSIVIQFFSSQGTLVRLIKRGRKKVGSKGKSEEESSNKESNSQRRSSVTSLDQNSGEIIEVCN